MKFTDQSIPGDLAALFAKLVSPKSITQGTTGTARTRRAVALPRSRKKPRTILEPYKSAVDKLIEYLISKGGWSEPANFRLDQIAAIRRGIFDETYWTKCAVQATQTMTVTPGFTAYTGPRNYAYPDPYNVPSKATYGAGTTSSGNAAYFGETISGIFADRSYKWLRIIFALKNKLTATNDEPLFLKISATINASSNTRPSRAMVSAVHKRYIVKSGSSKMTTTEAPVTKATADYYRYETPRGVAPYFNLALPLEMLYPARGKAFEETGGDLVNMVVLLAPMTMLGHRFNNNTTVTTSLSGVVAEAWQIKKKVPGWRQVTPPTGVSALRSIAWGNGIWVAQSQDLGASTAYFCRGTDVDTWEKINGAPGQVATDGGSSGFGVSSGITYGNGMFMAIGYYDSAPPGDWRASVQVSHDDGLTWAKHKLADDQGDEFAGIAFAAGKFMIIGYDGNGDWYMVTTTDGITFSPRKYKKLQTSVYASLTLSAANDKFVLTDPAYYVNNKAAITTDGDTFTTSTVSTAAARIYGAIYADSKYVIAGNLSAFGYYTSSDETTWAGSTATRMTSAVASSSAIMSFYDSQTTNSYLSADLTAWEAKSFNYAHPMLVSGSATDGTKFIALGWKTANIIQVYD